MRGPYVGVAGSAWLGGMVKRAVPKPNLQPSCRFRPLELPKVEPWWRSEPGSNAGTVMVRGSIREGHSQSGGGEALGSG